MKIWPYSVICLLDFLLFLQEDNNYCPFLQGHLKLHPFCITSHSFSVFPLQVNHSPFPKPLFKIHNFHLLQTSQVCHSYQTLGKNKEIMAPSQGCVKQNQIIFGPFREIGTRDHHVKHVVPLCFHALPQRCTVLRACLFQHFWVDPSMNTGGFSPAVVFSVNYFTLFCCFHAEWQR